MSGMQNLVDELGKGWRAQRSLSQMTLGQLIALLKELPKEELIIGIGDEHSYRGYYSDLAFEIMSGTTTVEDLLSLCLSCLGKTFEGYKGGDFYMDEHTPLWIAGYGRCGKRFIGLDTSITPVGIYTAEEE